jgi:hypothetical protein
MDDRPNRRPPNSFEPPPWERAQFEELERRREEARQEDELATALAAQDAVPVQAAQAEEEAPAVAPQSEATAQTAPPPVATANPGADPPAGIDDKAVEAMLLQLRAEEPAHDESLWKVSLAFSGFSAVIGSILLVWGAAALMRTGSSAAGMIGGAILLAFGGLFVGIGAWLAARSLKERGVL